MAPRNDDPKLITHVINFELVQPTCSRYMNITDRRTDRETDDLQQLRAVKNIMSCPMSAFLITVH